MSEITIRGLHKPPVSERYIQNMFSFDSSFCSQSRTVRTALSLLLTRCPLNKATLSSTQFSDACLHCYLDTDNVGNCTTPNRMHSLG